MNVNKLFSESELLGMPIDVDNIFDVVGNKFWWPYVLTSKLDWDRHIFFNHVNQKFFQNLSKNIPIFFFNYYQVQSEV